jgi:hypothetical protein
MITPALALLSAPLVFACWAVVILAAVSLIAGLVWILLDDIECGLMIISVLLFMGSILAVCLLSNHYGELHHAPQIQLEK